MKKITFLLIYIFYYFPNLFSAQITIGSLVINKLDDNPIGINVNFYVDDDKTSKAPKKLSTALKEMGVKYLRYPGGDKSDTYLFSVPPYNVSKPTPPRQGKGSGNFNRDGFFNDTETDFRFDPLDFDEFMTVCREAGCEPVIVVAADMYGITKNMTTGAPIYNYKGEPLEKVSARKELIDHAAAWVYYANVKKNYNVKYWMIGNETFTAFWDRYENGVKVETISVTPEDYGQDLQDFSKAMKAVCPNIQIIANGVGWTVERFLKVPGVVDAIDQVCTSNYPMGAAGFVNYDAWAKKLVNNGVMTGAMDEVLGKINANPAAKAKGLKVWAAEFNAMYDTWGSEFDLGHALCNMDILCQTLLNKGFGKELFWNTRWGGGWSENNRPMSSAFDALYQDNEMSPKGFSISMIANHLYPQMVQSYTSGTYDGIMTFASRSLDNKEIYLYVINTKATDEITPVVVNNRIITNITKVSEMYGDNPDVGRWHAGWDYKVDRPVMSNVEQSITGTTVTLKKYSATVFHINLQ